MPKKSGYFRMDFVIKKIVSINDENKTVTFTLIPDPRRYEWKVIEGKKCLYDKFDETLFTEEVLNDLVRQMVDRRVYFQPQEISDAEQYIEERVPHIHARLKGDEKPIDLTDKSESFLESLAEDRLLFVIMSVDIVKSTKLITELDGMKYNRLITTTLYEISEVVSKFHGHVLKYTGDGLIAYFPSPSFITKNDLAINCALTIKQLVYKGLNQVFRDEGYPCIDIRIGLDSGEAYVLTIGSPETKRQKDIIGAVVSLATKIQGLGNPGDILLGDVTLRNLHTDWRERCEEIVPGENWIYKVEGEPYKVYKVRF